MLTKPYLVPKAPQKSPSVHYECHIARSVEPNQSEFVHALQVLEQNTADFVQYQPIGRLGVRLVMLESALKQIIGVDKKGIITEAARRDFETELNQNLARHPHGEFLIADPREPFVLQGRDDQELAIQLAKDDYRLHGDRAVAEEYIRDTYPGISAGRENVVRMEARVAIGEVQPQYLSPDDRGLLAENPSDFMLNTVMERQRSDADMFGLSGGVDPVVFPDAIILGGLHVVCQKS